MIRNIICGLAISTTLLAVSCGSNNQHNGKTPIARVYDTYLYYEDLGDLVPKGADPIDSALKVKQYQHMWARQQLMKKKAELYLTPEQKDVQRQLDEYRDNLLVYRYKDEFVKQNLDTVVTSQQIYDYYKDHPADFVLNSPAVKAIYVQMLASSDNIKEVRRLIDYRSEKDSTAFYDLVKSAAVKFDSFDNRWVSLASACKYMPDRVSEKNDMLRSHGTIYANDEEYVYLLKIRDCIPSGGLTPYEMAEPSISMILINKRKSKVINDLEQNILDNAIDSKNLEYFQYDSIAK